MKRWLINALLSVLFSVALWIDAKLPTSKAR